MSQRFRLAPSFWRSAGLVLLVEALTLWALWMLQTSFSS